jgi:hypothetical protein
MLNVLIDRTVPLVDSLIRMSRLPILRSTLDDVLSLVTDLRPDGALPGQRADGGDRGAP